MRHAAQTTRPLAITVAVTASLALAGCSLGTDDVAESELFRRFGQVA